MTEHDEIASLKADVESLLRFVKSNTEAKIEAERTGVLAEIKSLSADIGQEFKEDEYKDASLDSLYFSKKMLLGLKDALAKKTDNGMANMHIRNGTVSELSAEELEDVLVDLISLAYGLPIADEETKHRVRMERMQAGYTLR